MISIGNSMLPYATKLISKEVVEVMAVEVAVEAVEEVVEAAEEVEEEALQEHLSQLVNHKHKLLSQQQQMSKWLVNYHGYLIEQGIKQMLSSKKLRPTSKSTRTSQDSTLLSKRLLSLSPLSKDPMSKDGYMIWESGLTDLTLSPITSLTSGTNLYMNLEINSRILTDSNNPRWNSKHLGCSFHTLKNISQNSKTSVGKQNTLKEAKRPLTSSLEDSLERFWLISSNHPLSILIMRSKIKLSNLLNLTSFLM
jgi:hypothetical protein